MGVVCCLLGAFPAAGLVALFYRFPVPFGGYMSGPLGAIPAMFGAAFYLLLGGFIILGPLGALAGLLGWLIGRPDSRRVLGWVLGLSLLFDLLGAVLISVWEYIYGPW
jgi:hypothetical protein